MTPKNLSRLLLLLLALVAVVLFRHYHLGDYLTLAYLKDSLARFRELYLAHRLTTLAGYILLYIVVTALSLPGAAIMTLAGGGLFGFWIGTVAISFASTIGATLACGVSRFILRDWVARHFGAKLAAIDQGIETEGAFYLFTLRLIPIFPFFVINLLMGLTKLRLTTYFWVSQLGMLPATMVFVNAGRELSRINTMGDVLSPGLLASFALLGLFPLTAKKLLGIYRRKFLPTAAGRDIRG
ncbi:MAG: TVP38/TMEM64 family protein [Desulfobulbaceae bacterium]|nr:TVP38/TMEM64 family protein [Desulfobulbaceae bacterium]